MLLTILVDVQDDATVESLSAQDKHGEKHGWAQRMYSWLFEGDLFAGVASDPKLMRIHSTAEEFDRAAEETLVPFQVFSEEMLVPFQVPFILRHCERHMLHRCFTLYCNMTIRKTPQTGFGSCLLETPGNTRHSHCR